MSDARCVQVLERCRARLPDDGRIICADKVLPRSGESLVEGVAA